MTSKRRAFNRPSGQRRYKKLFIIAVEGDKTEYQYFKNLKRIEGIKSIIHIECLKSNRKSSPPQVLRKMLKYLKQELLQKSDEAWLVVDKDKWTETQLTRLYEWSQQAENYGFALSNPKFEYWLLLHFESGDSISTIRECCVRLKRYIPDYDKDVNCREITLERIHKAIQRAKTRDNPACVDWPRAMGTTVYRLIENILKVK